MANLQFDKEITALLVIDPYNDFISEGGKVWDRLKAVAEANSCVPHMVQVLHAVRQAGLRVFYSCPTGSPRIPQARQALGGFYTIGSKGPAAGGLSRGVSTRHTGRTMTHAHGDNVFNLSCSLQGT